MFSGIATRNTEAQSRVPASAVETTCIVIEELGVVNEVLVVEDQTVVNTCKTYVIESYATLLVVTRIDC